MSIDDGRNNDRLVFRYNLKTLVGLLHSFVVQDSVS